MKASARGLRHLVWVVLAVLLILAALVLSGGVGRPGVPGCASASEGALGPPFQGDLGAPCRSPHWVVPVERPEGPHRPSDRPMVGPKAPAWSASPRSSVVGGGPADIWDDGMGGPAATPWGFPSYQVAANGRLPSEWDDLRAAYAALHQRLDLAYAADPSPPFAKGAALALGMRTPGSWQPAYAALDRIRLALGALVEQYRVDPPTARAVQQAALLKLQVVPSAGGGPARELRSQMTAATGARPGNEQDAVLEAVDRLVPLVLGFRLPELLPRLPPIEPAINELAPGGPGIGVALRALPGPVVSSISSACEEYRALRQGWETQRDNLAPGTPTDKGSPIDDFSARFLAVGRALSALAGVYLAPPTPSAADASAAGKESLVAALRAVTEYPRTFGPLRTKVAALLLVPPPPLSAAPAELAGFAPASAPLIGQNPPATVAAIVAVARAALQLRAWYSTPPLRERLRDSKALALLDGLFLSLEAAVAAQVGVYATPHTAAAAAQAQALRETILAAPGGAYGRFAERFRPPRPPVFAAVETAVRAVPELLVAAEAEGPGAAPTLTQRLLRQPARPLETARVWVGSARLGPKTGPLILEASSLAELDALLAQTPEAALEGAAVYGLVPDQPGDRLSLLKAAAINLQVELPESLRAKPADRLKGATGWLYLVARLGPGEFYKSLRDYLRPELYAVD